MKKPKKPGFLNLVGVFPGADGPSVRIQTTIDEDEEEFLDALAAAHQATRQQILRTIIRDAYGDLQKLETARRANRALAAVKKRRTA